MKGNYLFEMRGYVKQPLLIAGEVMAIASQPAKEAAVKKKPPTRERRVVVTGMGVTTPIGHDPHEFYENLLQGVSGISEIEAFDCSQYPTRIAGEIKSFSTDGWIVPKLSKRMDKFMLYMLTVGKKALSDGGITEDMMNELDKRRCGVLIGSAMGGMKVFHDAIEALRISYRKMNPFCVPFATTNMGSAMLAMDLDWEDLLHAEHFHSEILTLQELLGLGIVIAMYLLWVKELVSCFWKNLSMPSKEVQQSMLNF